MKVSLSSTAARGALVGVALLVAAYLCYFSVRTARAEYYIRHNTLHGYERATQIEPEDARTWYFLGRHLQHSLEDQDPQRAISSFLKALEIDPHSTATWLDLAALYESEGNLAEARSAFLSAKKTYPLSAEVSWRYGNFLLRQGQLNQAFVEIRHSVEADPFRAAEAFSRCVRAEPDVDVILDRVLPADPRVYVAVIQDLTGEQQVESALKVWKRVAALHPQLALPDVFTLVVSLRQNGHAQEAHEVWEQAADFAGLAHLAGPGNSAVWDGGFESDVLGQGYTWKFSRASHGVQISFDSREKHSGQRSLRVSFDGNSDVNFHDVCQTVPMQGGTRYELSGWMQTEALTTDRGVRMELRGGTSGAPTTVTTAEAHGTQPWTRFEVLSEGAKENQEIEICLRREPSDQEDNKISGTVWLDDVALTAVGPGGAKR
ncbi:MAG: tetratricopeptide repeat protein [Acidobacteriota bacterium]|nr:tetratricopeptide repeat protein [Acidobacteriota bacterium]